jgi:hypothetical protein
MLVLNSGLNSQVLRFRFASRGLHRVLNLEIPPINVTLRIDKTHCFGNLLITTLFTLLDFELPGPPTSSALQPVWLYLIDI